MGRVCNSRKRRGNRPGPFFASSTACFANRSFCSACPPLVTAAHRSRIRPTRLKQSPRSPPSRPRRPLDASSAFQSSRLKRTLGSTGSGDSAMAAGTGCWVDGCSRLRAHGIVRGSSCELPTGRLSTLRACGSMRREPRCRLQLRSRSRLRTVRRYSTPMAKWRTRGGASRRRQRRVSARSSPLPSRLGKIDYLFRCHYSARRSTCVWKETAKLTA
jgi:hypothetical protein